jgi:chromosomal replication initiator protein
VANLFIAGWIENHFLHEISEAVRHAIGSNLKITFTIDSELSVNLGRPSIPGAKSPKRPDKQVSSLRQLARQTYGGQASRSLKLTLDTFVVGPPNELAYNAAKQVARQQQSPFNPLFIHGGYGLGKTHLLQGVCNEVAKNRPQTDWLYLSAEDFANQFVLALKTKRLEGFRQKIRQMDLLAIDDIHFLANKPSTQEEFLHTFNTINLAGKQIVLASDAHPKMISQLSEKLINRFISGMVVKIEPPDFQTRCEICRQYAARVRRENSKAVASLPRERTHDRTAPEASGQSLTGRAEGFPAPAGAGPVPESVIKYIAENLRGSVRELEGALLKVIAYSALQNEKITLAMAQAVLAEHLERCDPIVHIADIESAAATYFGTTTATMHSSKKDRTVSLARHFSMYLARKHTKMSSAEIGRFMGNKNHATVLLACKRIEDLITRNADLHWQSPAGNRVAKTRDVLARLEESVSA